MPSRQVRFFVILAMTAAACGGTSAPATAPAAASGPVSSVSSGAGAAASEPAPASAPASAPAAATAAASPSSGVAGGGGGAGSAADACAILTPAEFGAVVGASGVSTQLIAGEVSNCIWTGNGTLVGATSFMPRGASAAFGIWASSSGVEKVGGVGDDAVWDPSSATLFVLKGDRLAGVTAGSGAEPVEDRRSWAIELGKIAAGRM